MFHVEPGRSRPALLRVEPGRSGLSSAALRRFESAWLHVEPGGAGLSSAALRRLSQRRRSRPALFHVELSGITATESKTEIAVSFVSRGTRGSAALRRLSQRRRSRSVVFTMDPESVRVFSSRRDAAPQRSTTRKARSGSHVGPEPKSCESKNGRVGKRQTFHVKRRGANIPKVRLWRCVCAGVQVLENLSASLF